MTQALPKLVTFDEFTEWRPEDGRYELHDGVIVEMPQPTGDHEDVVGFIAGQISYEYIRLNLPYFIPKTALVKSPTSEASYSPDILLLNRTNLVNEPLWKKKSTVIQGASVPLIVEVVSTNWDDDYYMKFGKYQSIGITEYWIVDYLGLGAKRFTGNPKQPTLSICQLIDDEYQISQFRGEERIISNQFPELNLTAQQIFNVAS
ncbi:MAG: Uma2 family endonuclease [Scytonematopsis contorta HA4267-MV1]|jgi:Uma2 family endonuclease|nr:Uma2 family endonuclease [Scytonematopsis contorta HA4267-MV1]